MIRYQQEYEIPSGQTLSIQYDDERHIWEVACWNEDGTSHWYLEFTDGGKARTEFNRWRI